MIQDRTYGRLNRYPCKDDNISSRFGTMSRKSTILNIKQLRNDDQWVKNYKSIRKYF